MIVVEIFAALLLRFLFVSPFMLMFWWLRRSARAGHPRVNGDSIEFPLARGMHILIWIVVGLLAAFSLLVVIEAIRGGEGLYAALIPLSVMVAIILAWPAGVSIDHKGIHQHHWLRADRVIAWNDVAQIRRGRNTGATYVKSRGGGRPILFSPLLIGQAHFEHEVKRNARTLGLDK